MTLSNIKLQLRQYSLIGTIRTLLTLEGAASSEAF